MTVLTNSHRHKGLPSEDALAQGEVCCDAAAALALYARCPAAHATPLVDHPALASELGLATLKLKDERGRLGLGSFKALGATHAIAKRAAATGAQDMGQALAGTTFVCASAGNHGLSMAAGAALFGARAIVYLGATVPEVFAEKLRSKGATVMREGADYEASHIAAMAAAEANGWLLLADSTWVGYTDLPRDVMEGYLIMGAEVAGQIDQPPTHIFLQAGVGGLAAGCAAAARTAWGAAPHITIVEPEAAPALMGSVAAGHAVAATGPVSNMGRLDCKEPSHLALKYLAREADAFMTVTDDEAQEAVERLAAHGFASTPSGVAGFAGLVRSAPLPAGARVLLYISEEAEDA